MYFEPATPQHVMKIALRVKKLIDTLVTCPLDEQTISGPHSPFLTPSVLKLTEECAGGSGDGAPGTTSRRFRAPLIFVLLTVKRWNDTAAGLTLYDAELYSTRGMVAEYIAQTMLNTEPDTEYLLVDMLCQEYSIWVHGKVSRAFNALEMAVDMHSTIVICSAGYQRCMKWLWRGWILRCDNQFNEGQLKSSGSTTAGNNLPRIDNRPMERIETAVQLYSQSRFRQYEFYKNVADTRFSIHFDTDRIRVPKYQTWLELIVSTAYLILYSIAVNLAQPDEKMRPYEIALYVLTVGFVADEAIKLCKVGRLYMGFWNVLNDSLYCLVTIAFVLRVLALTNPEDSDPRYSKDTSAYYILSCAAPLVWGRMLLYLDSILFFGSMLSVLKELMAQSLIFFVLLVVVGAGFLQAFVGLDTADGARDVSVRVTRVMVHTLLTSPEFEWMDNFAPPYGEVLYYVFVFLVLVILVNILIALFNSAYSGIYENATNEYLANVAQKTLRFVRAPDEHVFIPPFNLVEVILLTPLSWFVSEKLSDTVARVVMNVLYSPFLLVISIYEARLAKLVRYNRSRGTSDDANEQDTEWDLFDGYHQSVEAAEEESRELEQSLESDPDFAIDEEKLLKRAEKVKPKFKERLVTFREFERLETKINKLLATGYPQDAS